MSESSYLSTFAEDPMPALGEAEDAADRQLRRLLEVLWHLRDQSRCLSAVRMGDLGSYVWVLDVFFEAPGRDEDPTIYTVAVREDGESDGDGPVLVLIDGPVRRPGKSRPRGSSATVLAEDGDPALAAVALLGYAGIPPECRPLLQAVPDTS